jgi:hypothetical protein
LNFTHMTISFSRFIYFTCLHTSFLVQCDHTLWVWSNIYFTPQDIFYLYNFTHACISSFVFHKSTPVGYLYFLGSHLYKYKSFFYLLSSVSSNTTFSQAYIVPTTRGHHTIIFHTALFDLTFYRDYWGTGIKLLLGHQYGSHYL